MCIISARIFLSVICGYLASRDQFAAFPQIKASSANKTTSKIYRQNYSCRNVATKLSLTILSQLHIKVGLQNMAQSHLHVFSGLPNSWFVQCACNAMGIVLSTINKSQLYAPTVSRHSCALALSLPLHSA